VVYNWLKIVLSAFLPQPCRLCGAAGDRDRCLCDGCARDLPILGPACPRCALPLSADAPLCGRCLRRPPPFDAALAPLRYAAPVDTLVHEFKFRGRLASGRLLAELMADAVAERPRPQLLLPVPLHPRRLRERGFNQAHELARLLGRRLGIPVDGELVRRMRDTPPQHELPAKARRANIRRAFALAHPPPAHVAVVDDVMTTGQTVAEIARLLKRAGARRVEVWVAARA